MNDVNNNFILEFIFLIATISHHLHHPHFLNNLSNIFCQSNNYSIYFYSPLHIVTPPPPLLSTPPPTTPSTVPTAAMN